MKKENKLPGFALICCLFISISTGCTTSSNNVTQPSGTVINVSGEWNGPWTSSVFIALNVKGTFKATVVQSGTVLTGTINVPEIGMTNAQLKGTVDTTNITFGDIDNKIVFTGVVSGNSSASGTYIYAYAPLNDNGTWSGTKK
ncbi:MAG: hypothetical protein PHX78_05010 [bacterium]|nr:hypothetical protein [bacterium]